MNSRMAGKTCGHCGYELTGLDVQGRCPECGGYYDNWSGEGVGGGPMEGLRRGDRVVRLFQLVGLVFLSVVVMGIGALYAWRSGEKGPLIFTGVIAGLFLATAATIGWSLRRK